MDSDKTVWVRFDDFSYAVEREKDVIRIRKGIGETTFSYRTLCEVYHDLPEVCGYWEIAVECKKAGLPMEFFDEILHILANYIDFGGEILQRDGKVILVKDCDFPLYGEFRDKMRIERDVIGKCDDT